jgi:hypothetical protein
MEKSAGLQKILDDLSSMGRELDRIQSEMSKGLALRVSVLERILELMKSEEREIVFERTERLKVRKRRPAIK